MTDLVIRSVAIVAAVALVAAPYWKQIATLLAKAAPAGRSYIDDVARVLVAAGLVAVAWGVIPISPEAALQWARIGVGVFSVLCAVALLVGRLTIPAWVVPTTLVASGGLLLAGASLPHIQIKLPTPITVPTTTKSTSAVYVYEKDAGPIPNAVSAGIDKLNRDRKIPVTLFEVDTKDGTGDIPEQYKAAVAAAKNETLPAFVALSGSNVIKVVKAPKTAEELVIP